MPGRHRATTRPAAGRRSPPVPGDPRAVGPFWMLSGACPRAPFGTDRALAWRGAVRAIHPDGRRPHQILPAKNQRQPLPRPRRHARLLQQILQRAPRAASVGLQALAPSPQSDRHRPLHAAAPGLRPARGTAPSRETPPSSGSSSLRSPRQRPRLGRGLDLGYPYRSIVCLHPRRACGRKLGHDMEVPFEAPQLDGAEIDPHLRVALRAECLPHRLVEPRGIGHAHRRGRRGNGAAGCGRAPAAIAPPQRRRAYRHAVELPRPQPRARRAAPSASARCRAARAIVAR